MIITRYHNKVEEKLTVGFLTPTFLGGADQNAELRPAPFKNLLRQWWRVAVGSDYADYKNLLKAENELFGTVLGEESAQASVVRLAITADVNEFEISSQPFEFGKTNHPEVAKKGKGDISNALYLGFGPIIYAHGSTKVKNYIRSGSRATLTLTFPRDKQDLFHRVFQLIDAFGAVGSRSRNGYGSIALSGSDLSRPLLQEFQAQPLSDLINGSKQYPSALGTDRGRLLCWETPPWETPPQSEWKGAMEVLAGAYLKTRTAINIAPTGLQQRHILGYPVTHHAVPEWGGFNGRMPSQLRLMVKRNRDEQLIGRILHLPHKLPKQWDSIKLDGEMAVWQKIHGLLDADKGFQRYGGTR